MFWVHAIQMPAVAKPGQNWLAFIDWDSESFGIEFALPRKTLGVSILDDKRLSHSTISAPNARLGFVHFDAPDMTATVTYRFVLFHRISVSAPY